ncbi:SusC/RagA family TonB-linked outer membrane protein [Natronoflexus pectinivorans]|uniref:TonB-linked SusC/RagA family outer membrane protein n=1 Tax=Natronoflexus pectinivorans TaxID=682526 RepID=A0A4R2GGW7_9BACT|nr:SusC/RagA family TonB-linked outer membrane protein [Natronoflexus pectinivorans]TCO07507.1 TonB-linked SusC/RagA family outer membrane protein [Natronoflexus pectinivorans]
MKKVLLALSFVMVFGISALFAQTRTITGTVTGSDDGMPIPGASVFVEGTTIGTVTQVDGSYSLNVPQDAEVLVFSFVGMETLRENIAGRSIIDIALRSGAIAMDEVVVVAYGTATRQAFTGSAAVVDSREISRRQVSNITQALAGQVAGVQATSSSGQPGSAANIRIRGIGSMSASNAPLYIVDGMPFEGNIAAINSQDIESISVLKDAAASAIYGARGANGVVIITTKQGRRGDAVVTVDSRWGVNSRGVPQYDVMTDPAMYYETFYRSLYNSRIYAGQSAAAAHAFAQNNLLDPNQGGLGYQVYTIPEGEYLVGTNFKLNPNATLGYTDGQYYYTPDDWYKELFDTGNLRKEHNVSVSGSTDKMNYFISAGYLDDSGIIDGSGFTRYTVRSSTDYQAKDWLKVGANVGYTNYNIQAPPGQTTWGSSGNLFYTSNLMAPIYPMYVRNPDGTIMKDERGITVYDFGSTTNFSRPFMGLSNPGITMKLNSHNALTDVLNSRWYAQIDLYEGLQFNTNIGVNVRNQRTSRLYNPFYGGAASDDGQVRVRHDRTFGVTQQYLMTYRFDIDNRHNIDLLAGYETYDLKMQRLDIFNRKLYNPNVGEIGNSIHDSPDIDSYTDYYQTHGFLGRVQYDYEGRIFVSSSFRRDASSRFHPDNQWGNFGSIGAAWLISRENFFTNLGLGGWLDLLKLKASYGMQGNDNLIFQGNPNYYPYLDQYEVFNADGDFATRLHYKGNRDITWETSHSFNTGIEFSMFRDRLVGSVEYFQRKTSDLLYYQPVPESLGYSTIPMNVGEVINKGVEVDLAATLVNLPNFHWRLNLNATHYKNEVLDLAEAVREDGIKMATRIISVGGSLYDSFLRHYAGVDPATGKALYYMVDSSTSDYILDDNGNRTVTDVYTETYQVNMGSTLPKVYGGFGTSMEFYGFDVSLAFGYQLGGKVFDGTYQSLMHGGDEAGINWHKDILDAWSFDNPNSNVPRLNASDDNRQMHSSRFLQSSDYLSINNITVGYTLPRQITDYLNLGSARIYFAGDNVALLTSRKGLDPRQDFGGINWQSVGSHNYSALRTLSGGISVTF